MGRDEIKNEASRLERTGAKVRCVDQGETVIVILEPFPLPVDDAYTFNQVLALAFIVPITYPDAQPDASGFYVKPADLKVKGSMAAPRSSSPTGLLDETWLKFSWAPKSIAWDPAFDNLSTFLANIEKRFLRKD